MDTRTGELIDKEALAKLSTAEQLHYKLIAPTPLQQRESKVRRNDPCPCRSGKKFKFCCLQERPLVRT